MVLKKILLTCYCIVLVLQHLSAQPLEDIAFDLPLFIINTEGQTILNETKIDAHLGIVNNSDGINYYTDSLTDYNGKIGIEIRGNGSSNWAKKSYLFETRKTNGSNNNVSLLGMPDENDWILYAPYLDRTGMRNVLTYNLAREMGSYASRTAYCELIVNGEYKGLYVLAEKIKRDKNRVNIPKFESSSSAVDEGGYIIRIDSWWNTTVGWQSEELFEKDGTHWWPRYQYVYPKYDEISDTQKKYIQAYMLEVDRKLFDLETGKIDSTITELIDLNSFVDLFLINELTKNPDGYRLSTYMSLDPTEEQPRLKLGPVWDYNVGYGNYVDDYDNATSWEYDNTWWEIDIRIPFWWENLMSNQAFIQKVICRWEELRESIITSEQFNLKIDSLDLQMINAMERNNEIWATDLIVENIQWASTESYNQNVTDLKTWIQKRIAWLDQELAKFRKVLTQASLNIYPNPCVDNFYMNFFAPQDNTATWYLYDVMGKFISSDNFEVNKGENNFKVENINVSRGTYFIKLKIGQQSSTKKIIILN